GSSRRMALWIASPPTCSMRTPRESLTAMGGLRRATDEQRQDRRGRKEGEGGASEDGHVVAAERVVRRAGQPRANERAQATSCIQAANDSRYRSSAVKIHDDCRQESDARSVERAEGERERRQDPVLPR